MKTVTLEPPVVAAEVVAPASAPGHGDESAWHRALRHAQADLDRRDARPWHGVLPPAWAELPAHPVPPESVRATGGGAARRDDGASAAADAAARSGAAVHESVRVHAAWAARGIHVWLGVDAVSRSRIAPLARALHRMLAIGGVRVLSMHCNGTAVASHAGCGVGGDALRADAQAMEPARRAGDGKEQP